jgi:alpha-glucoside transport system substrate-binding protein
MGSGVRTHWMARLAVVAAFLIVLAACGQDAPATTPRAVTFLGSWEGPELDAFQAVIDPFEQRTGIKVLYSSTRDLKGVIERGLASGNPPDIAGLPGPGYMFAIARQGRLKDLASAIDLGTYKRETAPAFVNLGTIDDRLVGVFIKGTVKGLIWHDPAVYRLGTPSSWSDLLHLTMQYQSGPTRAWCVGLQSGASSGWPGTDWIEDFVLRQSGPDVYDAWVAGTLPWTSSEIRSAFVEYTHVVAEAAVYGGARGALTTYFSDAGKPLFTDPPGCLFLHQGSFMTSFLDASASPRPQYDFFPFPAMDPRYSDSLIAAGDLVGMFNDTPSARALVQYLVSAEAQSLWVARGGALSGNFNVGTYPSDIAAREAALLTGRTILRFDASDSMPDAMGQAFWQAVLDVTATPSRLDVILEGLDSVRTAAYGH